MTTAYILAAGDSTRFNGYPKCLLDVEGEPLLSRTRRLFDWAAVKVITHVPAVRDACPDAPVISPARRRCTCESLLSGLVQEPPEAGDRVLVLLGDVYYDWPTRDEIREDDRPVVYWTDGYEQYAVAIAGAALPAVMTEIERVIYRRGGGTNESLGKLKSLWVSLSMFKPGLAVARNVRDRTQDFDEPGQWQDFLQGRLKNGRSAEAKGHQNAL